MWGCPLGLHVGSFSLLNSPVHSSPFVVEARINGFARVWKKYSSYPWVLNAISKGYLIDFSSQPVCSTSLARDVVMGNDIMKGCDDEVASLHAKGAIIEIRDASVGVVSPFFSVLKETPGKFRPIVYIKYPNSFIRYEHFKMENSKSVRSLVCKWGLYG
jgi:hypothetical protein